jgi:hypothetical protein
MTNVIPFEPKTLTQTDSPEGFDDMPRANEPARLPYSFDIAQAKVDGMVLLDACVPSALATEFMRLLVAFQNSATPSLAT